jgi:hypothetical protein
MSSIVSNVLMKNVINRFVSNGHSCETAYLIVKYFIGVKESKILHHQEQMINKAVDKTKVIKGKSC